MEKENQIIQKLNEIQVDIEFIKEALADEGELTDWAKNELEKARNEPEKSYVSINNL